MYVCIAGYILLITRFVFKLIIVSCQHAVQFLVEYLSALSIGSFNILYSALVVVI